jgi:hypothetical protein
VLQNYLVTAARHFVQHRLYAFINIAGLAVGLACTILIALFARDELSYDQWIPHSANLHRVEVTNVIAWPVAYYYLHHWLEGYACRITRNPLYFLAAGVVALTIAWVTIITHAVRIARASPIVALRYE